MNFSFLHYEIRKLGVQRIMVKFRSKVAASFSGIDHYFTSQWTAVKIT